jgi:putative sugar O-methyltransferase
MNIFQKIYNTIFPKRFHTYYKEIKNNKNLDKDLIYISDIFINSESYQTVSNQWHILNISDYKNLLNFDLNNLGTKVFNHYYNFYDYQSEHLPNLFKDLKPDDIISLNSNIFKTNSDLNLKEICNYNYLLLLLYFNLKKSKYFEYFNQLNDDTYLDFGQHFINIDNHNITSDKIISLFDLENIEQFSLIKNNKILEIGAGSGRLTECILTTRNISNYTICDIPPAIYISYKRLKKAFPGKKIELLIDIKDADELCKRINSNYISFIFPHQIKKIKKKLFDLTIAVDCLHEMNKSTLEFYFKNINNISHKFYFSIWKETKNWGSKKLFKRTERLHFEKGDYPMPLNWQLDFKKDLKFPSNYISAGYNLD